jgi:hypothetical protein
LRGVDQDQIIVVNGGEHAVPGPLSDNQFVRRRAGVEVEPFSRHKPLRFGNRLIKEGRPHADRQINMANGNHAQFFGDDPSVRHGDILPPRILGFPTRYSGETPSALDNSKICADCRASPRASLPIIDELSPVRRANSDWLTPAAAMAAFRCSG